MYTYDVFTAESVNIFGLCVIIADDSRTSPHIGNLRLICPTIGTGDMISRFQDFETSLIELGQADVPLLLLYCRNREVLMVLLALLLAGNIFPQLFGQLRKVSVSLRDPDADYLDLSSDDILSAPTHSTLGDTTIALDSFQRVGWLLRTHEGARMAYLRGLPHTTQAEAPNTGLAADHGVGREMEVVGVPERVEEANAGMAE